jgi:hypothetical protein
MPHIKPASREARAAYRQGLPPELRGTFDQLAGALADWRYELDWYHQVGTLLRQLREGATPEGGGSWLKGLPGALNVSPGLLVKASRFAQLYPRKKDVRELEKLGLDWTGSVPRTEPSQFKQRAEKVLWCYGHAQQLARQGIWTVAVEEKPNFQVLKRRPIRRAIDCARPPDFP